nr:hypothetical protein Iba_chr03aCG7750 [Ipomoea batatas]
MGATYVIAAGAARMLSSTKGSGGRDGGPKSWRGSVGVERCRGWGKNDAAASSLGEKTPLSSSAVDRAHPLPPPLLLCLDGKKNRGQWRPQASSLLSGVTIFPDELRAALNDGASSMAIGSDDGKLSSSLLRRRRWIVAGDLHGSNQAHSVSDVPCPRRPLLLTLVRSRSSRQAFHLVDGGTWAESAAATTTSRVGGNGHLNVFVFFPCSDGVARNGLLPCPFLPSVKLWRNVLADQASPPSSSVRLAAAATQWRPQASSLLSGVTIFPDELRAALNDGASSMAIGSDDGKLSSSLLRRRRWIVAGDLHGSNQAHSVSDVPCPRRPLLLTLVRSRSSRQAFHLVDGGTWAESAAATTTSRAGGNGHLNVFVFFPCSDGVARNGLLPCPFLPSVKLWRNVLADQASPPSSSVRLAAAATGTTVKPHRCQGPPLLRRPCRSCLLPLPRLYPADGGWELRTLSQLVPPACCRRRKGEEDEMEVQSRGVAPLVSNDVGDGEKTTPLLHH